MLVDHVELAQALFAGSCTGPCRISADVTCFRRGITAGVEAVPAFSKGSLRALPTNHSNFLDSIEVRVTAAAWR
jgi:hypothetical protein